MTSQFYQFIRVLACFGTLIIAGCQQPQSVPELLAETENAMRKKEFSRAEIYLRDVLSQDNVNAKGRFLFAELYFENGNWAGAVSEYQKALDYKYDQSLIYPHLAQAYYRLHDLDRLTIMFNDSRQSATSRESVEFFYAMQLIAKNQVELGVQHLRNVLENSKQKQLTTLAQAVLLGLEEEHQAAIQILDDYLRLNPDSSEAIELKGHILLASRYYDLAAVEFKRYFTLKPGSIELRLLYANTLLAAEDYEGANQQVDLLLQYNPHHPFSNLIKAQILFRDGHFHDAYIYADKATQVDSPLTLARVVAGSAAYRAGKFEKAYLHLVSVEDEIPKNHDAYKILALVRLQLGYSGDAITTLQELQLNEADNESMVTVTSSMLQRSGETERAIALLSQATISNPNSAILALQHGRLKFSEDSQAGLAEFEQALKLDPELIDASVALAMFHISNKDFNKAHEIAVDLESKQPELALTLKSYAFLKENKVREAKLGFEQVLALNPSHTGALFSLGLIFESARQFSRAVDYYQDVVDVTPEHNKAIERLLHLAKDPVLEPEILAYFNRYITQHEANENITFAAVELYFRQEKLQRAESLATSFLTERPNSIRLRLLRGEVREKQQRFNEAMDDYEYCIEISSRNTAGWFAKVQLLANTGDISGAFDTSKDALQLLPNSIPLRIQAARLNLAHDRVIIAEAHVQKLPVEYLQSTEVLKLRGDIAIEQERLNDAVVLFRQVYSRKGTLGSLIELLDTLQKAGETEEAVAIADVASANTNYAILALEMKRAELYSLVDKTVSLSIYRTLQINNRNDYSILNNLAWTYMQNNQLSDALETIQRAHELAPNEPAILDTYGVILMETGRISQAVEKLELAYRNNREDHQILVHLIQVKVKDRAIAEARQLIALVDRKSLDSETLARLDEVEKRLAFL